MGLPADGIRALLAGGVLFGEGVDALGGFVYTGGSLPNTC